MKLGGRSRWIAALFGATLAACVSSWPAPEPTGYERTAAVVDAGQQVGPQRCFDCHDSFEQHHVSSDQHAYCEACHGPGERHAFSARAADIRHPSSDDCMACHRTGHDSLWDFEQSGHARAGLLCTSCHDTHGRELRLLRSADAMQGATLPRAADATRLCTSCHSEVAAEFGLPSHHPIAEGMLECGDCHSPHSSQQSALGARTDSCAKCHQEVMGPWIYEHPPAAEDCSYCHVPHGASADDLLETPQPAVCISCHSLPTAGAVHDPWAFTTRCSDCHNAIHGSFSDPHLRR